MKIKKEVLQSQVLSLTMENTQEVEDVTEAFYLALDLIYKELSKAVEKVVFHPGDEEEEGNSICELTSRIKGSMVLNSILEQITDDEECWDWDGLLIDLENADKKAAEQQKRIKKAKGCKKQSTSPRS